MNQTTTFEMNGHTYHTDAETLAVLNSLIPAAKEANDFSGVAVVMGLGLKTGRIMLLTATMEEEAHGSQLYVCACGAELDRAQDPQQCDCGREHAEKLCQAAEPHVFFASLIDPEQEYPVGYAYHQQRGRIEAPASGVMPGKDLTRPQIIGLCRSGQLTA